MGFAAYKAAAAGSLPALAVAHYALNLSWVPVFFGLQWIKAGAALQVGCGVERGAGTGRKLRAAARRPSRNGSPRRPSRMHRRDDAANQ